MNFKEKIEQGVMGEIEAGRITPRPKYVFVIEKFGLAGIIACSIVLAIALAALVAFSFKASRAYDYLQFGIPGIPAFLEAVPVILLILLLIVCAATFFFFTKTDVSYKKPLAVMVIATLGFVLLSGGAIAYSRSEKIQASLEASHFPARVVRPFVPATTPLHKRGVAGEVVEVGEEYVALRTPRGDVIIDTAVYAGPIPTVGDVVIVVGGRKSDVFQARGVRILHTSEGSVYAPNVIYEHIGEPSLGGLELRLQDEGKVHPSKENARRKFVLPEEMAKEVRDCFDVCLQETKSLKTCRNTCISVQMQGSGIPNEIQIKFGL